MATKEEKNLPIEERAWNNTKTKDDPEYALIPAPEFKEELRFRARKVLETGTAITNFEQEVKRLNEEQAASGTGPMAVVSHPASITAGAAAGPAASQSEEGTKKASSKTRSSSAKSKSSGKKAESKKAAPDQSGHVKTGKEAAAEAREESTAPKHP